MRVKFEGILTIANRSKIDDLNMPKSSGGSIVLDESAVETAARDAKSALYS
jgi:hypothetical protein